MGDHAPISKLRFDEIEDKESHWEVDHHGQLIIKSPIPVYPKPLALSYRGLYQNFGTHVFETWDGGVREHPRALASAMFALQLLRHYFPGPEYTMEEVWPGTETTWETIVEDMPIMGTRHFIVQCNNKSKDNLVAVVVIVTDSVFFQMKGRKTPEALSVDNKYINSNGKLILGGKTMSRGALVVLTGVTSPVRPALDFYDFDSSRQQQGELLPCISRTAKRPDGELTNSISLAPESAGAVDAMFKDMVAAIAQEHGVTPRKAASGLSGSAAPK